MAYDSAETVAKFKHHNVRISLWLLRTLAVYRFGSDISKPSSLYCFVITIVYIVTMA